MSRAGPKKLLVQGMIFCRDIILEAVEIRNKGKKKGDE